MGVAVVATHPDAHDDAASSLRHTVYSARYRLLIKGPERGQWESDVVPLADAPLATLDDVVRGVLHRSGEALEPERIPGSAFRSIVGYVPPPSDEAEFVSLEESSTPSGEDVSS
jgi:hypothetical protein